MVGWGFDTPLPWNKPCRFSLQKRGWKIIPRPKRDYSKTETNIAYYSEFFQKTEIRL